MAIVQEVGAGDVILGTVLASGSALAQILYLAIGIYVLPRRGDAWRDGNLTGAAAVALIFCASLLWWGLLAILTATILVVWVRRRKGWRPDTGTLAFIGLFLARIDCA